MAYEIHDQTIIDHLESMTYSLGEFWKPPLLVNNQINIYRIFQYPHFNENLINLSSIIIH